MSHPRKPPPHWLLERLAADDLPEARARVLREEPAVEDALADIAHSDRELLAQHPPEQVLPEIGRRLSLRLAPNADERSRRPARALWFASAAGLTAVALWLAQPAPRDPVDADSVRERGLRPHLLIFRKTTRGVEQLADGAQVRSGELLQLAYVSAGRTFGVVASIDGRGEVTFHLPEQGKTVWRLNADGQTALPHAFELDDSQGVERFLFVSADEPFSPQLVVAALRNQVQLSAAYTQHEVTLEKVP
jgi:hypothetical protein